jgi:hypothetical protein
MLEILLIVTVTCITPLFLFGIFSLEKEAYDENYLQR